MKRVIVSILILSIIYAMFKRRGKVMFTEADAMKAIERVSEKYGAELARIVERIFRLETAHFTSLQYRLTGTAGMEAGKWKDLANLPTVTMNDSDKADGADKFIKWNPVDFALYLAEYIKRHNGNYARWYSTNSEKQAEYRAKLATIKNRFA